MEEVVDLTDECPAGCSHLHDHTIEAPPAPAPTKRRRRKDVKADQQVEDTETSGKKRRKAKADKPVVEKRVNSSGKVVRYCKAPPRATRERIERALPGSGHRMFLLSRKTLEPASSENGGQEDFEILGSTGNVYKVSVSKSPTCTCPDAKRRSDLCKHVLYVMIRVLRLAQDDHLVWQRGLLLDEVREVLSGRRSQRVVDSDVLADAAVLEAHKRMSSSREAAAGVGSSGNAGGLAPGQRAIEGDCPICYDELHSSAAQQDAIVFCKACGNNVHRDCFQAWAAAKQGAALTCVWCRAPWPKETASKPAAAADYVNLRDHSALHKSANTSLNALYGNESAIWIGAHTGQYSMRQAVNMARAASGRS